MKKLILSFIYCLVAGVLFAQTPQFINYQGVASNADGPIHGDISIRISITNGQGGPAVYTETHAVETNSDGLFSLRIGSGVISLGTMAGIDWGVGQKYLRVEMDENGGNNFTMMGTSHLVTVPYAFYAENVANADDADADPTNEIELPQQQGGDAGLVLTADGNGGVSYESINVNDSDSDPANELQDLVLTGSTLTLSNDPTPDGINLAPYLGVDTDDQQLSLVGTELTIADGNTVNLAGIDTDEQTLSFNDVNGELSIADGNAVDLSSLSDGIGTDDQDASEVAYDNTGTNITVTTVQEALSELDQDLVNNAWQVGGNSTNQLESIGTSSNQDLSIIANNAEVIRVAADGDVGIGVSDPQAPLHVVGGSGTIVVGTDGSAVSNAVGVDASIIGANYNTAINGFASGAAVSNAGIQGTAFDSDENFGVKGWADGLATNGNFGARFDGTGSGSFNVGSYSSASGTGDDNRGVWAYATDGANFNYAVFGQALSTTGNNYGFRGHAAGATDGTNYGVFAHAENSTSQNVGVWAEANGSGSAEAIGIDVVASESTERNIGLRAFADYSGGGQGFVTNGNIGGWFSASSSNSVNTGVLSVADGGGGTTNHGVTGSASGAPVANYGLEGLGTSTVGDNYGVYGNSLGITPGINYGVFGSASNGSANYAGYFEGDVTVTGALELGPLNFPTVDGASNQVLVTDGNGNLGWANQAGGGAGWSLTGNTTGVDATFGTNDNFDVSFITNGNELMRLDSDGDVGIGVSNPTYPFQVLGQSSAVRVDAIGGSGDLVIGIDAMANSSELRNYGIQSQVANGTWQNIALNAQAESTVGDNYGARTYGEGVTAGTNYGLHALAENSTNQNTAIWAEANGGINNVGLRADVSGASSNNYGVEASASSTTGDNISFVASAFGATSGDNKGVQAVASNSSTQNIGVDGSAFGSGTANTIGLRGYGSGADENYGVYGFTSDATAMNYGVYGRAENGLTNYGVYGEASSGATNYAGYFLGDVHVTGTFTNPSDRRLKRDIHTLTNSLSSLLELRGTSYYWKDEEKSQELQLGVIAQELEKVYPELVNEKEGTKSVNYLGLIPVLIEAIKEQQLQIEGLEMQLVKAVAVQSKRSKSENQDEVAELQTRLERLEALLGAQASNEKTKN